ncbi:MAG: alkaline phosphatase family protein [Thermoleophilia bacterium]|nr:alkaline phosphatase family protein [Thermoleophilia bacterium]
MRALCLGLDGADFDLVDELRGRGRLPTIARLAETGAFGPLHSTIPALTPTAWSSFLTGLNPAGHGIFNFTTNPNRARSRVENAASRAGAPFWRALGDAGVRSAFVGIPFTYPPEPVAGVLVTGYGGPPRPAILPERAAERIFAAHPDLVTARHPMAERWWEDYGRFTDLLVDHVEQTADVCRICLELEPDLRLLCANFMSSDFAGHLGYVRFDPGHPAHDPAAAGDELVQVYEAVDRACGALIDHAAHLWGEEPTVLILSDHGMKPIYWAFHLNRWLEEAGYLRYRRRSLQPLRRGVLARAAAADRYLGRTRRRYAGALDRVPLLPRPRPAREFADIDFGRTRAYSYGTGGQIFLSEASGAVRDRRFEEELVQALTDIRHPETGERAFDVRRKEELYRGPFLHKAPELVILPHDERIHVDQSRRHYAAAFERHERLDPRAQYGYSGHHGLRGILAAGGPGLSSGPLERDAEITQVPATLLSLFGLSMPMDGVPLALAGEAGGLNDAAARAEPAVGVVEEPVYSEEEEAAMAERLRDLGYE